MNDELMREIAERIEASLPSLKNPTPGFEIAQAYLSRAIHTALRDYHAAKLRIVAAWFDVEQASGRWGNPDSKTPNEVQDALRRWADLAQAALSSDGTEYAAAVRGLVEALEHSLGTTSHACVTGDCEHTSQYQCFASLVRSLQSEEAAIQETLEHAKEVGL